MYKITRKGKEEPFFIEDTIGEPLFRKWAENEPLPSRLVVGNTAFMASDIKSIEQVIKTKAELAPSRQAVETEYSDFRKKMLSLPIEKRALITKIPELLWSAHVKVPMPPNVKTEIQTRQLEFFKKHPNHIHANPIVYRELIPSPKYKLHQENITPLDEALPNAITSLVGEMIATDYRHAQMVS